MARRVRGQLIEALLDGLEHACLGVDRSGRIRFINSAMRALFEVDGEVDGQKVWDVLPINDLTRTLSTVINQADPESRAFEQVLVLSEERVFACHIIPAVTPEGRYQGAVTILEDMAPVQKIERGLDQFLVGVNNQLKIPLTSIKGYVETLLEGAYSNPDITRRFLQVINDETNRLARLVMSLEEAAGAPSEATAISTELLPVLRSSAEMFREVAAEKNLALEVDLPATLPTVELDPKAMQRAVVNLIDNAVKCTGLLGHGTVRVAARGDGAGVDIIVSDTGVGIPAAEQERIFEQFYRVQDGPAAELGGTGLGLYVVWQVAAGHRGTVEVDSRPGEGATFTIHLPG